MANKVASPALKPTLSVVDASAIVVGMVIGAGIFETPTLVAQNAGSQSVILFAWLLGGVASLIGALCYAELTTAYPHPGGDYHYFMRAFGTNVAFLFAWARMTVIQTGSITLFAYAFGDYASQILPLGSYSSAIYAALCIAILTGLHIMGVQQGKWTQNLLTLSTVLGLALVIIAGMITVAGTTPVPNGTPTNNGGAFGLAFALTWCLARDRWWRGMAISRRACFLFHLALWGVMVCGVLDGLSGYRGEMLLTEGQSRQEDEDGYIWLRQAKILAATSGSVVSLQALKVGGE